MKIKNIDTTNISDNDIFSLLKIILNEGLTLMGYSNFQTWQSYQPTRQGLPDDPSTIIFVQKIPGDHAYGMPSKKDTWDEDEEKMFHTETQKYQSTFQISGLQIQDPEDISFTASDLVNSAKLLLYSDRTIYSLYENGLGILKPSDVQNIPFIDDKDRNEFNPVFTFDLTYNRTFKYEIPVISGIQQQGVYGF